MGALGKGASDGIGRKRKRQVAGLGKDIDGELRPAIDPSDRRAACHAGRHGVDAGAQGGDDRRHEDRQVGCDRDGFGTVGIESMPALAHADARQFGDLAQHAARVADFRPAVPQQVPPDPQGGGAAIDHARDGGERRRRVARIRLQHVPLQGEQQIAEVMHQPGREEGEVGGGGRHGGIVPDRGRRENRLSTAVWCGKAARQSPRFAGMHAAMSAPYDALRAHFRAVALLGSTSALLAWDQETYLPRGGGDRRAEQLALLAELAHERATAPEVGDWLLRCEDDAAVMADDDRRANVRGWRRDYDRAVRLPPSLVAELAEVESKAQQAWAEARARDDFRRFQPWLLRMVALQQQKADCLRRAGQSRWDALADLHEPGMNAADLAQLFGPLRLRLVALRERLAGGRAVDDAFARVAIDEARQEAFVRAVLGAMGFDPKLGRLDRSAHPFCTRVGDDVRLTTRFRRDGVLDALGSTMHEGGHGLYEQGLDPAHFGSPLGEAVSLGVHESQSRLWENHVGRSEAFWQWCWPLAQRHLGEACVGFDAAAVHRAANVVRPSLIRVEADEATYDLHIMVRFELEQRLLDGALTVDSLPGEWGRLYREHLGIQPPDDRQGCLQDVHWSCGLFGYFPTYTLGNLYAAQFVEAADRALGGLGPMFARGEFAPLREWLRRHVHQHGRRHEPAELCRRVTGGPLSPEPFLRHLERRLGAVYGLA